MLFKMTKKQMEQEIKRMELKFNNDFRSFENMRIY